MKRIEKIIKQVRENKLDKENLIIELEVLKALIENVEKSLESLKQDALLSCVKEEDKESYARSIAYGTSLMLLEINMEEE